MTGTLIDFIGIAAGIIAVSIAVYFQWIIEDDVPPKYVMGFALLGFGLMFIITNDYVIYGVSIRAKLLGYLFFLVIDVWGYRIVIREIRCKRPIKKLKEVTDVSVGNK